MKPNRPIGPECWTSLSSSFLPSFRLSSQSILYFFSQTLNITIPDAHTHQPLTLLGHTQTLGYPTWALPSLPPPSWHLSQNTQWLVGLVIRKSLRYVSPFLNLDHVDWKEKDLDLILGGLGNMLKCLVLCSSVSPLKFCDDDIPRIWSPVLVFACLWFIDCCLCRHCYLQSLYSVSTFWSSLGFYDLDDSDEWEYRRADEKSEWCETWWQSTNRGTNLVSESVKNLSILFIITQIYLETQVWKGLLSSKI